MVSTFRVCGGRCMPEGNSEGLWLHLLHELCWLFLAGGLGSRNVLLQKVQQWLVNLVIACSRNQALQLLT